MSKRSSSKQLEPLVFFTDRDLGPTRGCEVVRILRDGGMLVEPFHDHFEDPLTPDHTWIEYIAERGWVGLSLDRQIRLTEISTTTLMERRGKLFVCSGTYSHPQFAENIVNSQHVLTRIARRNREPFIAALYMASDDERRRHRAGEVKMKLTLEEWQFRRGGKGGTKPG